MKKHAAILLAAASLLGGLTSSCELNETVYSAFDTNNFYKTAGDAELALTAAYAPLNDLYLGPANLLASDLSADQTYPRPVVGRNTLTLFSYDATYNSQRSFGRVYESPQQIWTNCYAGIERANLVIERVPAATMDETRKGQIIAEAYFLRAFYHWTLTKNFGDVVLKTESSATPDKASVGKSTKAQVYQQIFADLDKAATGLPSYSATGTRKGTPSKETALALHAKAALYAEDYPRAADKAQQVIGSGKYSLIPNVVDLYNVGREDANRAEVLWAYEGENTSPNSYTSAMGFYGPRNSDAPSYGKSTFGSVFAYQSFFNSFSSQDQRRQLLDTFYISKTGARVNQRNITPITAQGVLVKKYQDPNSVGDQNQCNAYILRLADVYLIAAEAIARQSSPNAMAYGYVNTVRQRAGLPALAAGLSQQGFIDAVLQERSWELFAEGDRWYDLTRTDKFLTVIPAATNNVYPTRTVQPRNKYFPIPQDEINANPKVTQNAGW